MAGLLEQPPGLLDGDRRRFTWRDTWPAQIAQGVARGLGMFGRAASGEMIPTEEAVRGMADVAGILGAGAPATARAGALGALGGKIARRSERFDWPVSTSYGKVVEMPITVNPSRSHIQRALSDAPHGDVRALRAPDGQVYLWPANEAMHVDIASTFNLPFKTRQDLQRASYLFNKKDVDALGKYADFDDLIGRLGR